MGNHKNVLVCILEDYAKRFGENLVALAIAEYRLHQRRGFKEPTKRKRIPKNWIKHAWRRQGERCKRCGEIMLFNEASGDHVIPLSRHGEHAQENISAMHKNCNSAKGTNDPITEAKRTGRLLTELY